MIDLKDIMALCKRRGFIFQASEIYGGINGFWDYGPLGVELKNNIRDAWWRSMVIAPPIGPDGQPVQIVGLDSAIIQNPKTWEASGHVAGFADMMVDCKESKLRYRQDHLLVYIPPKNYNERKIPSGVGFVFHQEEELKTVEKKIKKLAKDQTSDINEYYKVPLPEFAVDSYDHMIAPDTDKRGTLTAPKAFNLMFDTRVGAAATDDNKAYLRPETAQGIFLNFKNVVDSSRVRMPFGIAQVGKSFRNEVTPRNFIFRSREFEQMELEWFCAPDEAKQWFDFWVKTRHDWWLSIGVPQEYLYLHTIPIEDVAHYAKSGHGNVDIEFKYPFTAPGYGELEGVAHRCDFDLTQHQKVSGQKMEYMDPEDTTKRYIPHVIEPAAGLTRGVLAVLCAAYTVDPDRPSGLYLNLHPSIAPKKAAILPLTAKGAHPDIATKLYLELRKTHNVDLDIKQNIGKRYARQDEIGTPFCFTIDDQTEADSTVTVRDRNTMKQERIALGAVKAFLDEKIKTA
jgi:glycyl-tRNA synthetase